MSNTSTEPGLDTGPTALSEPTAGASRTKVKTGGMNTRWVEFDGPKPPAVEDHYAHWNDPLPVRSERCRWWEHQIARGWRPNKYLRREGYDTSSQRYGVYIWEYINVLAPTLHDPPSAD